MNYFIKAIIVFLVTFNTFINIDLQGQTVPLHLMSKATSSAYQMEKAGLGLGEFITNLSWVDASSVDNPGPYGFGLSFATNFIPRMTITQNGYVGIGTISPGIDLDVNGGMRVKDVIYLGTPSISNGLMYGDFFIPGITVDGSVLFGSDGGALATQNPNTGHRELILRWNAAGNVGIGINTPSNKFDVATSTRTGTHATNLPFYATGDIGGNNNGFEFRHTNGTQGIGLGYNTIYAAGSNTNQDLGLTSRGTGNLSFNTNGVVGISANAPVEFGFGVSGKQVDAGKIGYQTFTTDALDIVGAGTEDTNRKIKLWSEGGLEIAGNVGIGTTTPNAPLQFSNDLVSRKIVLWEDGNNDNQFYGFGIDPFTLRYQVSNGNADHVFYSGVDVSNSKELMRITGVGKVGIGTAPTKGTLHVRGSVNVENAAATQVFHISAEKQLVFVGDSAYILHQRTENNPNSPIQENKYSLWVSKGVVSEDYAIANPEDWDDYVFNEDYKLPTIEKVAAFVKTHKHLPNIPSEAEVKRDGYSQHQMNRNFLKTIEELTLYTIEQDQKIKALEAKVAQYEQLASEVEKLKAMMTELKK